MLEPVNAIALGALVVALALGDYLEILAFRRLFSFFRGRFGSR